MHEVDERGIRPGRAPPRGGPGRRLERRRGRYSCGPPAQGLRLRLDLSGSHVAYINSDYTDTDCIVPHVGWVVDTNTVDPPPILASGWDSAPSWDVVQLVFLIKTL